MMVRVRFVAAALVGVFLLASVTGCSGRSEAAFCSTMEKYKSEILDLSDSADLLGSVGALSEMKAMWVDLAKVAPPEIQSDVEIVRDSWAKAESVALDGDLIGSLGIGLGMMGSLSDVDTYVRQHCDP